jgi:hypothetical protein
MEMRARTRLRSMDVTMMLAACLLVAPTLVSASQASAATGDGSPQKYSIRLKGDDPSMLRSASARNDCLIVSNNGTDTRPSRWPWGAPAGTPNCNFPSEQAQVANAQSVWILHGFQYGPTAYYFAIESAVTGSCLAVNAADTSKPILVRFGSGGDFCGTTALDLMNNHREAIWDLATVESADYPSLQSIRSIDTNTCLIFGNNGQDLYASLYRWSESGGLDKYCGMNNPTALQQTVQATYEVDELH